MVCLTKKVLDEIVELPTNGVKTHALNTKAFIADQEYGVGTLCISESNLLWKKESNEGLCIEYPNIALHAVSRDLAAFPFECIYILLDFNILKSESDSEDESDETENITVIRFVPQDKRVLDQIFLAMNECQALHTDKISDDEECEDRYNNIGYENYENEFEDDKLDENEINEMNPMQFNETTDPDNVELSAKGMEILNRLNLNFQEHNAVEKMHILCMMLLKAEKSLNNVYYSYYNIYVHRLNFFIVNKLY